MVIGVISDTHGLLRPAAAAALRGCSAILHAGDVGRPEVLEDLRRIAPVTAVRGNVDTAPWARALPEEERVHLSGLSFLIVHDVKQIHPATLSIGIDVVVSGHTHKPRIEERKGILYLNPGSAGPRRFRLPVSLALVRVGEGRPRAELVDLLDSAVA